MTQLSAFGTCMQYMIHATALAISSSWGPPPPSNLENLHACCLTVSISSAEPSLRIRFCPDEWRVRDKIMPIVKASASNEDPPYEINGNVMPFGGMRLRLTAILMIVCMPNKMLSRNDICFHGQ